MKTYSDLLATDTLIPITIELQPIGNPWITVIINDNQADFFPLTDKITFTDFCDLLNPISIKLILSNKHYTTEYETAVIINRLTIDNIEVLPKYDYLAEYNNDHDNKNPTSYLGFNGQYSLTIDRPFYQWLHHTTAQGWLLT